VTVRGHDPWSSGSAYDAFMGRWSRLVARRFLDWLDPAPDRRWLDIGCGTGVLSTAILECCAPESLIGVDPSEAFVAHARATTDDPRATFVPGSADATGLDDGSVDVVVSGLVLNFVPDLGGALGEALRVARPGGTVAGYVWDYADGMQLLRGFWDAAVALDPEARALDEGARFPVAAPEPLGEAFRAAGLTAVEVRAIEVPTVFADFDDLWNPFLRGTGPAPGYVASLTGAARTSLRDRLRQSLVHDTDGSIALAARAWAVRGERPDWRSPKAAQ